MDDAEHITAYHGKEPDTPLHEERLFHEINLLRLEGYYFCLDPKEAARRRGKREFLETIKLRAEAIERRPVVIAIDPEYGQPSTTAYKILQAIIKKLSDYGYPIANTVYFSQRELARLSGRTSFGGNNQQQFFQAIMQLRDTKILCWFYDKEHDTWAAADFQILDATIFSGKAQRMTQCCVRLNDFIVKSLNSRYAICLNYTRMQQLEPIGIALYKHIFYHFSNIYSAKKRKDFLYNKDYGDICTTWLGGLKILRFRSKILQEQLGRHLRALKTIKLIKTFALEKNSKRDGFTLVLHPGSGFFEDYVRFYEKQFQIAMPFRKASDARRHEEPLSLVHEFYTKLYPGQPVGQIIFSDKETELARSLLATYTFAELQDLVAYTLEASAQSQFPIRTFGGVRSFIPPWLAERDKRAARQRQAKQWALAEREEQLRNHYEVFKAQAIERYKTSLTPEALTALESAIREHVKDERGPAYTVDMLVRVQMDNAIAKELSLPSFEEWKAHRERQANIGAERGL